MKRNARTATALAFAAAAFALFGTAPAAHAQDMEATGERDRTSAGDVSLDIVEPPGALEEEEQPRPHNDQSAGNEAYDAFLDRDRDPRGVARPHRL